MLVRFMSDFQSKLWFTYRKDMLRIEPSAYTSDAGWGCMMRTGQSLLAQAFVHIILGRDWRYHQQPTEEVVQKYCNILSWFADEPERYYSIHNIAKAGVHLEKRIGDWFGPATVAHALNVRVSDIERAAIDGQPKMARASMESVGPNFYEHQSKTSESTSWKPVVILLPARFGLEKLTERYINNLKRLFRLPQFLGIAGGRPGRSLYFVASQGNELFYFDPHFVKPRATQEELSCYPSIVRLCYHCNVIRSMDILEMDPSMLLGFLIRSADDLVDLCTRLKTEMEHGYPLLTIVE
ncbi:hypothetical protein BCR41DRAFT_300964, partial [Lobosporangium transversale]